MNFKKLQQPFPEEDIEWRMQSCGEKNGKFWGRCLAYVTNRAIQARLDEVAGPGRWRNEYAPAPLGGILCGLSIKIGSEWVTKWDGAENTDIEAIKGGLSGAMKRAAVQWGIGRYLYKLPEGWADVHDKGRFNGQTREKKRFKWNPPPLPDWALPPDYKALFVEIKRELVSAQTAEQAFMVMMDHEDTLVAMPEAGRSALNDLATAKRQELTPAAVNQ
jgi:hypothetical protein